MYTIQDNTPSAGYISWSSLHITYLGTTYSVANGNTNKRYAWWAYNNPTVLTVSDALPTLTDDDVLLFYNKNGIHMTIPTATVIDGGLIVSESIMAPAIAANAITTDKIEANAITTEKIEAGAITTTQIAAYAITTSLLAVDAVGASNISAGAIETDKIQSLAITGDKIAANTITANKLVVGTITAASGVIADAAITNAKIADATIQSAKISSIDAAKITSGTLDANRIGAGSITVNNFDANIKSYLSNGESSVFDANPNFYDWSSTYPAGWSASAGSAPIKVASDNNTGNSAKYVVPVSTNTYMSQYMTNVPFTQYVYVETTFKLESGAIDGAGLLFRYYKADGATILYDNYFKISDLVASPTLNKWYTVSKIFKVNASTDFSKYQIYVMGGWTSFGSIAAKTIYFDSVITRPATEQEINAYETGNKMGTWSDTVDATKISGGMIQTRTISADKLVANTITAASGVIADATITTAKIQDGQITTAKIANLAVDSAQIKDAAITNAKIGLLAVDTANIKTASITSALIKDAAVGTAEIADLAVTTAKINDLSVGTAKIIDGAITTAKIGNAQITNAKINDLDAGKITAGTLDANRIGVRTITADKMTIGDFTNLSGLDENNPGSYTIITNTDSYKYFKAGPAAYSKITLAVAEKVEFKLGDQYYISFYGWRDSAASVNFMIRYYYTDATWNNAASGAITIGTTTGFCEKSLAITAAPTAGKVVDRVEFFFEKNNESTTYYYIRNVELRKMYAGQLIVDGSITAEHISASGITGDLIKGGTILGQTIKTAPSGARVELTGSGLKQYNSSGAVIVDMTGGQIKLSGVIASDTITVGNRLNIGETDGDVNTIKSLYFKSGANISVGGLDVGMNMEFSAQQFNFNDGNLTVTDGIFKQYNPNFFKAYKNTTAQSISSNAWIKVTFNAESFDTRSIYDMPNNKFIAPENGIYLVNAMVTTLNQGITFVVIYKNGTLTHRLQAVDGYNIGGATLMKLNDGDYLEVYAYSLNASNTIQAGSDSTYFTATMLY